MIGFYYSNYLSRADFVSTDGTSDGAIILQSSLSGTGNYYRPKGLDWTIYNNNIYFSGTDSNGDELWVTDGTQNGTYMVKDILPEDESTGTNYGYPKYFKNYNDKFYFSGRASSTYDYTDQIWESDGTTDGTQILTVLPYGNLGLSNEYIPDPCKFTLLNSKLYFQAYENEIWETDGTADGSTEVKNIGFGHKILSEFIPIQNKFIFITYKYINNSGSKYNLWVSDGTTDGTFLLRELNSDAYDADGDSSTNTSQTNRNFVLFNDKLYFITGENLRVTDGTVEGSLIVKNFDSFDNSNIEMITYNNKMFFIRGYALWESDGSQSGTSIVKELPSWYHNTLRVSNNLVYFYSFNTDVDSENLNIWVSDGTTEGTNPIGTPVSIPNTFQVHSLFSYDNDIYTSTFTPGTIQPLLQFWKLNPTELSLNEFSTNTEFNLWPNPLENSLTITSKSTLKRIDIYDNIGQILLSTSYKNKINTSYLTSGIYFVKIEDISGRIGIQKVIKK